MGYVFDFRDTLAYRRWIADPRNRPLVDRAGHLMLQLLQPRPGETVLDIGCGTGESMRPFLEQGLQVSGLDPSPYMVDMSHATLGSRVELHRGVAEDLPFDDNAFHHACLVYTLEFVEDPLLALQEAARVARQRLYIGILNRFAPGAIHLRLKNLRGDNLFRHARLFGIGEIKYLVRTQLGDVPVEWRTTGTPGQPQPAWLERVHRMLGPPKSPFGSVAGIVVDLVPRYRTIPLPLRLPAKGTPGSVAGLIRGAGAQQSAPRGAPGTHETPRSIDGSPAL